jgi:hypothetical protein
MMEHLADAVEETVPLDHRFAFAAVQSEPERTRADSAILVFGVKRRELFVRQRKAPYRWVLEIQPEHEWFGRIYLFLIRFNARDAAYRICEDAVPRLAWFGRSEYSNRQSSDSDNKFAGLGRLLFLNGGLMPGVQFLMVFSGTFTSSLSSWRLHTSTITAPSPAFTSNSGIRPFPETRGRDFTFIPVSRSAA